ncbi:MAG TPA: hypothetical protein VNE71_06615 [Myxococcota bacterium]|nr:hypothetical protein [Myxococcota bacterium]
MRTRKLGLPFALALLLSSSTASAVESLTGTWEGVLKCETLDSGNVTKSKVATTLEIRDFGGGSVAVELVSTDLLFLGFVVAQGSKPERGVLSAASCAFGWDNLDGGTFQGDVRVKPGSGKASLRAQLTIMGAVQELARSCTLTAKRVNTAEPDVDACAV